MARTKKCPEKVRLRTELDAKIALALTAGSGTQRYYHCPVCRGYHLTSQDKGEGRVRRRS